jgi:hypothetical protein
MVTISSFRPFLKQITGKTSDFPSCTGNFAFGKRDLSDRELAFTEKVALCSVMSKFPLQIP